jgi:hypothetical protein
MRHCPSIVDGKGVELYGGGVRDLYEHFDVYVHHHCKFHIS